MGRGIFRARIPLALWLAAVALNFLLSALQKKNEEESPAERRGRVTRLLPDAPDSTGTFRFRHRWSEGSGGEAPRLRGREVDAALAYEDLREMCDTYGVPETWTTVAAVDWAAKEGARRERKRRNELIRRAAERGVSIHFEGDTICSGPDYEWIVRRGTGDVRDVATRLSDVYRNTGLATERDLHRVVASFVQSIEYAIPAPSRPDEDGQPVWNFGIATPVELLHNKWGDCDSKCLLFASLLENFPGQNVVFLVGNDHMFAGVREIPRRGDRYVTVSGVSYVLVELTDLWPLGRIPKDMWQGVGRNEYRILRVAGGRGV
ncbi:hypothetical protein K8I85_14925 [bacterium]|nr:hypothetical protein [bacterium]